VIACGCGKPEVERRSVERLNATIKSGTNQYHGAVFEFLRNNNLDANNFFTNAAGLPRAPFHQNQFGAAMGGAVVQNRAFFFADFQGTRQATSAGSSIRDVPPIALRGGKHPPHGRTPPRNYSS
jgi:hypothetical protein